MKAYHVLLLAVVAALFGCDSRSGSGDTQLTSELEAIAAGPPRGFLARWDVELGKAKTSQGDRHFTSTHWGIFEFKASDTSWQRLEVSDADRLNGVFERWVAMVQIATLRRLNTDTEAHAWEEWVEHGRMESINGFCGILQDKQGAIEVVSPLRGDFNMTPIGACKALDESELKLVHEVDAK